MTGKKRSREEMEQEDEESEGLIQRHYSDDCTLFISNSLCSSAWSKLNDQRLAGRLCDVTLVSEDGMRQHVHRCVLAASTEYFSRMFEQTGFTDHEKKEVELHGVPGEALVRILDCMYTGSLELTTENVHDIISASDYLLYSAPQPLCVMFMCKVLKSKKGPQEALKIISTAEKYQLDTIKVQAWEVIFNNFGDTCLSQNFKTLSLTEVVHILKNSCYYVTEELVFTAVLNWLEHDMVERKKHLEDVAGCVRFPLMPTEFLLDKVYSNELFTDSTSVKKLLDEAMRYKLLPLRQSKMQSPQTKPRGKLSQGIFCIVGTESVYVFEPKQKIWYSLSCPKPLPNLTKEENEHFSYNLVMSDKRVYAIGKVRSSCETGRYIVKSLQSYDEEQNSWKEESVPANCENTVFVDCLGSLYACSKNAIEVLECQSSTWKVFTKHKFATYDFVFSDKGFLKFYNFASGILVRVDVKNVSVKIENFAPHTHMTNIGTTKNLVHVGNCNMLVTMKSPVGYAYKLLDLKTFDLGNAASFLKAGSPSAPHNAQSFPLCLDMNQVWHIASSRDAAFVMASHPPIMCKHGRNETVGQCEKVHDSVMPFFSMKRGHWERMPSIPEQVNKPISICALYAYDKGTTVACKY